MGVDRQREEEIALRVFVPAINARFVRQIAEFGEGGEHLLRGAFEHSVGERNPPAGCVDDTTLDSLGLKKDDRFGYWFDFGDDWWHQINVEAVEDKVPRGKFPKVTKRVGKSPPQYAEEDE